MEGIHGNIILCYSSKLSLVWTAAVYNCLIIQEFSEMKREKQQQQKKKQSLDTAGKRHPYKSKAGDEA